MNGSQRPRAQGGLCPKISSHRLADSLIVFPFPTPEVGPAQEDDYGGKGNRSVDRQVHLQEVQNPNYRNENQWNYPFEGAL